MLKVEFSAFAYAEMKDAQEYYNLQQDGLGDTFIQEIKSSVDRMMRLPILYTLVEKNIRKCILHKFPYAIFYTQLDEVILILSVAHQHRKPFYWVSNEK